MTVFRKFEVCASYESSVVKSPPSPSRKTLGTIIKNMQGTWIGKYKYDRHPNIERENIETLFTLIIKDYDGVNFKGIIHDDLESGGTRGEGNIEGTLKSGKIAFIKKMPVKTMVTKKGMRIEAHSKHKPIYYTGTLNVETFEGEWKIKGGITFNKFIFALGLGTTGTWKMKKK